MRLIIIAALGGVCLGASVQRIWIQHEATQHEASKTVANKTVAFTVGPRVAAGEWKEEIQIPPCQVANGRPNVEVNFTQAGDRVVKATIECSEMPVGVEAAAGKQTGSEAAQ